MTWPSNMAARRAAFLNVTSSSEEMRVANIPVRPFFVADRQSGPTLIRYASSTRNDQTVHPAAHRPRRDQLLYRHERTRLGLGPLYRQDRAARADGGWLINGTKIWTSNANVSDYMIGLFRTSPPTKGEPTADTDFVPCRHDDARHHLQSIGQMSGQKEFQRGRISGRVHSGRPCAR